MDITHGVSVRISPEKYICCYYGKAKLKTCCKYI